MGFSNLNEARTLCKGGKASFQREGTELIWLTAIGSHATQVTASFSSGALDERTRYAQYTLIVAAFDPGSGHKILIIDDNASNVTLLEQLLSHDGYTNVRSLIDPSGAVKLIEEWHPDLILLDLHMPIVTGYEILERLQASNSGGEFRPVLVWTADQTMAARTRALNLGANDFITKPFDATELLLRVRNFLRMRDLHQRLQDKNAQLEETNLALQSSERSASLLAQELQAANRELEGFVYSVSHDLRGPLRAILATSRMLQEDYADRLDSEGIQMLERQGHNAARLSSIIDDLLKLARVSRSEMAMARLDVTKLATEAAEELSSTPTSNHVKFKISEGLTGHGDALLVRLALLNLMSNAAKFSPAGSEVEVGAVQANDHPTIFVRDRGIGFDMVNAERLFEPFERLVKDSEYPGTGIGLANVKRIVERHGGTVWAESEPGHGATFYFTLAAQP